MPTIDFSRIELSPGGRWAVLVCAYRGAAHAPSGALATSGLGQFVAMQRDLSANPRSLDYISHVLRDVLAEVRPENVDVTVDEGWGDAPAAIDGLAGARRARIASLGPADLAGYDRVLIVYPDPLGLSWGALERRLAGAVAGLIVLNGRRRIFPLDARWRRALAWRRFLAETRLAELAASVAIWPVAAGFALADRVRGR